MKRQSKKRLRKQLKDTLLLLIVPTKTGNRIWIHRAQGDDVL
jgi:hypothetical protein